FANGRASEASRRTERFAPGDSGFGIRDSGFGTRASGFGLRALAALAGGLRPEAGGLTPEACGPRPETLRAPTYATLADSDIIGGTWRSGIGVAANSRWHGLAISRAQVADRLMRALSVAMPVLAYICR